MSIMKINPFIIKELKKENNQLYDLVKSQGEYIKVLESRVKQLSQAVDCLTAAMGSDVDFPNSDIKAFQPSDINFY